MLRHISNGAHPLLTSCPGKQRFSGFPTSADGTPVTHTDPVRNAAIVPALFLTVVSRQPRAHSRWLCDVWNSQDCVCIRISSST